ncbi:MAG: class II aldolase/adducin family protein [Firmicutes bacterium]|nr:class II aldolase/adducin family protein [Alicyclobacillaceae bacterium]MCL6496143.1 class II aldolase/adducin family protein [Bacillota bacterium]
MVDPLILFGWRLEQDGLAHGTSGNLSRRVPGDRFRITPSGMAYRHLTDADLVEIELPSGRPVAGTRRPSSEWRLHQALYLRRSDVQAVVHVHAPYSTVLACLGRSIPPLHYVIARLGDAIPLVPYATFGTQALADAAAEGIGEAQAILLQNHGLVAVGRSLAEAYQHALDAEWLATLYYRSLAVGEPIQLSTPELDRVRQALAHYGQADHRTPGRRPPAR